MAKRSVDRLGLILDTHCQEPVARWICGRTECRIERLTLPPIAEHMVEQPKLFRLHWAWTGDGNVLFERRRKDFATLDELYDWTEQQRIAPERAQMTLGI